MQPTVEVGCLYDRDGHLLAEYRQDPQATRRPTLLNREGANFSKDGYLELLQRVRDQDEVVGTLYLCSNMDELHNQLWGYVQLAALMAALSLTAGLVFAFRLQRTISRPILQLTDAARRISGAGDYSIRLKCDSKDELGSLMTAFNHMLHQTQVSKAALQGAHDQLEDRVKDRTAALEAEIAQRERTQVELVRARDSAEAANRAKSQFLANMSHEIRTPLNAVLGFTDLLLRGADDGDEAERQDYLETIQTSGKHLLSLINDILDLAKVESGCLEMEQIRCAPHEIICEVISVLRVRAQEHDLTLDCHWPDGVPETIQTDPARLRQLLMNLIGNALKFTKQGGVDVVAAIAHTEPDAQLMLQVIDTGIGIPPDKLEQVFDPFVQADNSVTREYGGTGLGLAICRRITEALGGTLTVESAVGRGSTFTATINVGSLESVAMLAAPPSDGLRSHTSEQNHAPAKLPSAQILVVEDGETNRKLINLVLQRAGAHVTSAENGKVGVALATETTFDLILMDMQMPVMDGYAATAQLRKQGLTVPIIALTAHAMKGDDQKCKAAGCSSYLAKPIDADQLLQTVAEALSPCQVRSMDATAPVAASAVDLVTSPAADDAPLVSTLPMDDVDFREIVEEFVAQLGDSVAAIAQSACDGHLDRLQELAHWLKGAGGTAGFKPLSEIAKRIEEAARAGHSADVSWLVAELDLLVRRIELPVNAPI
jgi:signal transduction histidine kinase/CheY-like chemotaxis protein/HPt (histidine-containing phosphotransfer) domain-containing protein